MSPKRVLRSVENAAAVSERTATSAAAAAAAAVIALALVSSGLTGVAASAAAAAAATRAGANVTYGAQAAAAAAAAVAVRGSPPQIPVLKCQPCELMHCVPKKASKLKCRGGTTTGICGCCHECAKVEGEDCGGDWHYLGKCDAGLYCSPRLLQQQPPPPLQPQLLHALSPSGGGSVDHRNGLPEGKCRRIRDAMMDSSLPAGVLRDVSESLATRLLAPRQLACQPKCTPDFCEKRPRAICSAIDVVDVKRECHGRCQHTSCQACSWVEPPVDCGACRPDDFDCLRRFASCVRRQHCTRDRFPCQTAARLGAVGGAGTTSSAVAAAALSSHSTLHQSASRLGKFQCEIPRCQER